MRWPASVSQAGVLPIAAAIRSTHQKQAAADISGRGRTCPRRALLECSAMLP